MKRALLVAAVLILASAAGCTSKPAPANIQTTDGTRPSSTINVNQSIDPKLRDKSRIEGIVHDDLNNTLAGVDVALFGTQFFGVSGSSGRFEIDNITPGTYSIHATKDLYRTAVTNVTLLAGHVHQVRIQLVPVETVAGNDGPHRHDYWGGAIEAVIFDREVEMDGPACVGFDAGLVTNGCQPGEIFIYLDPPEDPKDQPNVVLPGTGSMLIEISVEGTLVNKFLLQALRPTAPTFETVLTVDKAESSSEIPVSNTTWDPPHATSSAWVFKISPATLAGPTGGMLVYGTIQMKITIKRGTEPIPLEQGHPDRWGARTNITLVNLTCESFTVSGSHELGYVFYTDPKCQKSEFFLNETDLLVLPNTGKMRATIAWEAVPGEGEEPVKFQFLYLGANRETDIFQMRPTPATTDEQGYRVFEFDVRADEWDSPYAQPGESKWIVGWMMSEPSNVYGTYSGPFTFKVEIFKIPAE